MPIPGAAGGSFFSPRLVGSLYPPGSAPLFTEVMLAVPSRAKSFRCSKALREAVDAAGASSKRTFEAEMGFEDTFLKDNFREALQPVRPTYAQFVGRQERFPTVINKACKSTKRSLIIVWDDLPPDHGPAKLAPHLTPLDWTLAFSTKVLRSMESFTPFSIHIIDLTSSRFNNSFSVQMSASICDAMPWVKHYTPLPRGRRAYETYFPVHELSSGEWPENKMQLAANMGANYLVRLDSLSQAWRASILQSLDHHDVNNAIGPYIFKQGERIEGDLKAAFLARMNWSGKDLSTLNDWKPWNTGKIVDYLYKKKISVLVVDDQLDQGWKEFVCKLIGVNQIYAELQEDTFLPLCADNKIATIFGCPSSLPLIERLGTVSFDNRNYADQVLRGGICPEIILLDLRLYSNIDNAKQHAVMLIKITQKLIKIPDGALAWQGICPDEVERIREWCNGSSNHASASDEALLLLPRLLALAFPLTPIILFSSTGQAWIHERLKPYRNVLTGFEKPRVLSNPDTIKNSIDALHDALDKAIGMLRLRLQLAHAQKAIQIATDERPQECDRLHDQYIEIYADETRNLEEGIISGMAVCIFPSIQVEDNLQNKLLYEFSNQGTVWARKQSCSEPQLKKGTAIHRDLSVCSEQVDKVEALLNDVGLSSDLRQLWSVVSMKVPPQKINIKDVSVASFPDGPLDEAIRFNLEFILFVLLPYITQDKWYHNGNVSIYIPTRLVALPPDIKQQQMDLALKFCESFNLGGIAGWDDIDSINRIVKIPTAIFNKNNNIGTAFPLIRGWLHSWKKVGTDLSCRISKIKMATLTYENDKGETNPITTDDAKRMRLFHDVADWICTASNPSVGQNLRECLTKKEIFRNWFLSTDTEPIGSGPQQYYLDDTANTLILVSALRMYLTLEDQSKSKSDVVREILNNTYIFNCNERLLSNKYCAQQRLILWRLENLLINMSGESLHNLLYINDAEIDVTAEYHTEISSNNKGIYNEIPDSQIRDVFPNAQKYCKNTDVGKEAAILFKLYGSTGAALTHCVKRPDQVEKIKSGQWSKPLTVYGEETGDCEGREKVINIFAVKMDNGNWKLF